MRLRTVLPFLAIILAAGLAWSIYEHLIRPSVATVAVDDSILIADLPAIPTFEMAPRESFSEVTERPLFSQTRRPPDLTSTPVAAPVAEIGLELQGIVIAGGTRIAVLRETSSGAVLRLQKDNQYRGWRLLRIGADQVTFVNNGEEAQLSMNYHVGAPPTRGNRRQATQRTRAQQPAAAQQQTIRNQNSAGQGSNDTGGSQGAKEGQ